MFNHAQSALPEGQLGNKILAGRQSLLTEHARDGHAFLDYYLTTAVLTSANSRPRVDYGGLGGPR